MGLLGVPVEGSLSARYAPPDTADKDYEPPEELDFGWIGQKTDGVWTQIDPEAALLQRPTLWAPVLEFRAGLTDLGYDEWERLSSFEYSCKAALSSAQNTAAKIRMRG